MIENCQFLTFKVNFLCQKLSKSFSFFFIEEYQFRSTFFLKWCPILDTSPLTPFSKFSNFLWVCWFLGKNISNFVPLLEDSTTRITIPYPPSSDRPEFLRKSKNLQCSRTPCSSIYSLLKAVQYIILTDLTLNLALLLSSSHK